MSRTDDDLARTVEEAGAAVVTRPLPVAATSPPSTKRNIGLLVALAIIAAVIIALVFFSFKSAAVYAKTVDQLVGAQNDLTGRQVRVQGTLVHGSLKRRDNPCEYRFKLKNKESVIDVRYPQCVVPDTFQDRPETDVDVTAEGKLNREGVFEATQIMAKCPSKYEEKDGKKVPTGSY